MTANTSVHDRGPIQAEGERKTAMDSKSSRCLKILLTLVLSTLAITATGCGAKRGSDGKPGGEPADIST